MSCLCDQRPAWPKSDIEPGLDTIARQLVGFPELRALLLSAITDAEHAIPFARWTAREGTDLGLMLLEMWAYLGDILSFYDEVHAHEAYLRTARRRHSLRKLVELLGYVPTPAVGATVELALKADGRRAVTLPLGTAFRSGAVDGGPPQVFELNAETIIHPARNRWDIAAPQPTSLADAGVLDSGSAVFLLARRTAGAVAEGDLVLVQANGSMYTSIARRVEAVEDVQDDNGKPYRQVSLDGDLGGISEATALADIRLYRPTQTTGLWTLTTVTVVQADQLTLEGVARSIRPEDHILVTYGTQIAWFEVDYIEEKPFDVTVSTDINVGKAKLPTTVIDLDAYLSNASRNTATTSSITNANKKYIAVHHGMALVGTPTAMPKTELGPTDALALDGPMREPFEDSGGARFFVTDLNEQAVAFNGSVDFETALLTPEADVETRPTMTLPVEAWGNVAKASRGETVSREVLGSGDATVGNQSFTLKKKPLTYLTSATTASGLASTLQVWIDGVRWEQVTSFYGQSATARVYVVRCDEDGAATVTFGDGLRGARLTTGSGNVVASFRFGAGAAAPEAGSIKQIAKPMAGLAGVSQPIAAAGGEEAEDADGIRTCAPQQAMFLGRAVSLLDYQAVVSAYPGVTAAKVAWAWATRGQRTVVRVWYIGADSLQADILARLKGVSDPNTPFEVGIAEAVPIDLALTVDIDPDHVAEDVEAAVTAALADTSTGLLCHERIGIGTRLRFSRIRAMVQGVSGVLSVRLRWKELGSEGVATGQSVAPGQGRYFDLEGGAFSINGMAYGIA
ncbi:MAG: hypothetical protein GY937_25560 [bacterium]|nr:hypothetical protein [bacterium]